LKITSPSETAPSDTVSVRLERWVPSAVNRKSCGLMLLTGCSNDAPVSLNVRVEISFSAVGEIPG